MTVRMGLVGAGKIGHVHAAAAALTEGIDLVYVVDADPASLAGFAPPIKTYPSMETALSQNSVDLVAIATPTASHLSLTLDLSVELDALLLVEKPLATTRDGVERIRSLPASLRDRILTCHHFAVAPEVLWATQGIDQPECSVESVVSAFYDPYREMGAAAYERYESSWMDSGVNQLSVVSQFVELGRVKRFHEEPTRASAWALVEGFHRGNPCAITIANDWTAGYSSKKTTVRYVDGTEIWLDHTAMAGIVVRDGCVLDRFSEVDCTDRKLAHYLPIYKSLSSGQPHPALAWTAAEPVLTTLLDHPAL
jgi:Oxidoreductase family, NAD-binding Rossmann fold